MFLGYLLIGSSAGLLTAVMALIAGQSLLLAVAAYFVSALLTIGGVIAVCAWKHAARNRSRQRHGPLASLNE